MGNEVTLCTKVYSKWTVYITTMTLILQNVSSHTEFLVLNLTIVAFLCIVLGEKVFVINVLLWLKIKLLTNKFNALK